MTLLTVWAEDEPATARTRTADAEEITAVLKELGIRFERWELADLGDAPTPEEVLGAYRDRIAEVTAREGYVLVDVARVAPVGDDPSWPAKAAEARARFLTEHRHTDDEDRFFAAGSGVFYLHIDGAVYAVLCETGDLLSVPARTTHWFDMGTRPDFVAVRFFHDEDGWVGDFTGSDISTRFPTYDEITASR